GPRLRYDASPVLDHFLLKRISASVTEDDVDENQQRVEQVLERSLEQVQTAEAARAVIERVERLSAGKTEEQLGQAAAGESSQSAQDQEQTAADKIEHAADRHT